MSANLSFAAGIAALGMTLRNSAYKGDASLDLAARLVTDALSFDPNGYRAQILELIRSAQIIDRQ